MHSFRAPPNDKPPPVILNTALAIVIFVAALGLLWLASHSPYGWMTFVVGIAFSYLLLTNYALFHEASHGNLHPHPGVNYVLGVMTGILFPMPFSMMRVTHQGHHLRNRTDYEMFDMYYATDNRLVRVLQWYSILCGLFWPIIPIGAILFALYPPLLSLRAFRKARSSSYLLGDIQAAEVTRIRLEVLLTVAFFGFLFWLLDLQIGATLFLYACFSFNWSTRQYIGHAFSKRDVIEGAWNLRHNRLMSWLLLHGEYDLNHHRYPEISWWYLPQMTHPADERLSYFQQYWRQWLGPREVVEPSPESQQPIPLSAAPEPRANPSMNRELPA